MGPQATYLRRNLTLLEWVGREKPDARVMMNTSDLGKWGDLSPRWRLIRNKLRLELSAGGRIRAFQICSMRQMPWGLVIRVRRIGGKIDELRLIWGSVSLNEEPGRTSLRQAAIDWARANLPGCRILSLSDAVDRVHTLSGAYLRMRLQGQGRDHLVIVAPVDCPEEETRGCLTLALLWLRHLSDGGRLCGVPLVHLLAPAGRADILVHRARFINPLAARVEVVEYLENGTGPWETRPPEIQAGPLEGRDFRWPVYGPFRWSSLLARVIELAPDLIQRYPRFQDYDSLRLAGLEFARACGPERDRIRFGVGAQQTELTEDNFPALRDLVNEIAYYRRADSPATDHPYYRMQSERWLECLLLSNVETLFPELARGFVYPQIPVYLGDAQGRLDILAADRQGNLVVMELKVSEDPHMPLQALDYWGRVIRHNLAGDFEKRGYFSGLCLSRARPKIYLVAPVFSFHESLEKVLGCLDPALELSKVSINEDWRCGVRILQRISGTCGGRLA